MQFSVPTTGYGNVYVIMDWLTTHSGEQNAQRQYSLDGALPPGSIPGSQLSLYAPGNDDFYGDSTLGGVVPVVFGSEWVFSAQRITPTSPSVW